MLTVPTHDISFITMLEKREQAGGPDGVISTPPPEQFLFSSTCFPHKVSNGLAASPTSLCAALLTNQTPSRSLEQEPEVMVVVSPWLQLSR